MYLYESHLGGFYSVDNPLTVEEQFCETCGDYDWEIGVYDSKYEAWQLLQERTDIFGSGGFCLDSVCSFICDFPQEELEGYKDWEMLKMIEEAIEND